MDNSTESRYEVPESNASRPVRSSRAQHHQVDITRLQRGLDHELVPGDAAKKANEDVNLYPPHVIAQLDSWGILYDNPNYSHFARLAQVVLFIPYHVHPGVMMQVLVKLCDWYTMRTKINERDILGDRKIIVAPHAAVQIDHMDPSIARWKFDIKGTFPHWIIGFHYFLVGENQDKLLKNFVKEYGPYKRDDLCEIGVEHNRRVATVPSSRVRIATRKKRTMNRVEVEATISY